MDGNMSKPMKANIIHTIMWAVVAIGMVIVFTRPEAIVQWGDDRNKTILFAQLFIVGYGTDFVLMILEKSKRHGYKKDERDKNIQQEAVFKSFVIILLYIFIIAIVLYYIYETNRVMPVGWMWFLAYSTITIANLTAGIFTFIGYRKLGM